MVDLKTKKLHEAVLLRSEIPSSPAYDVFNSQLLRTRLNVSPVWLAALAMIPLVNKGMWVFFSGFMGNESP